MLRNYFKTAYRNLWRNKQFTIINTGGLAVGMLVFLFIMQYVAAEWNSNRFNKNYNNIVRVNIADKNGKSGYLLPPGLAPLLSAKFAAIDRYTRLAGGIGDGVLSAAASANGNIFREENLIYADSSFLHVFPFPLIAGTATLSTPNSIALSASLCRKLYGNLDVIGKVVLVSNQFGKTLYSIKAVYGLPAETDIKPNALLSIQTLESAANRDGNDWADPKGLQSGFASLYLQLKPGTNTALLSENMTAYIRSILPESKDDKLLLQPLAHLHLPPDFHYPMQTYGNLLLVTVFAVIASLILLLAWVNYINLSTAQAVNRARETGVRKLLGATRRQLIFQYLAETFIITVCASLLALVMANLFQGSFNRFTGRPFSLAVLNDGRVWLTGTILVMAGSLFSGAYVAFVLTGYKPVSVLSGKLRSSVNGFSLRKALVVGQFTVSVIFIIATLIIYQQLKFMQTENLGMNLEQLLVIKGPTVTSKGQAQKNASFKNALVKLPFVTKIAASNNVPGMGFNFSTSEITRPATVKLNDARKSCSMFICDERFFDTYGIGFKQGNTFTHEDAEAGWNTIRKVIINEKAASALGFAGNENLVGKKIIWEVPYEIVGVVRDYHHLSLHEAIVPTIYLPSASYGYFTVQTDSRNMALKISAIKELYNSSFQGNPFEYFFADEKYDQQYFVDKKIANVFIAAAAIAIFIACLGLYGLTSFAASQRVKEIGIRKVLGASVYSIAGLLSKDYIRLVLFSIVIATPVAWIAMHKWLQEFAYRTPINGWMFLLAGGAAVIIAFATISLHTLRSAQANPVKSLRNE